MNQGERRRRPAPKADDPDDRLVVREDAASFLEMSEPTLRRRQEKGEITPERVVNGVNWYSMKRLAEYKLANMNTKNDSAGDVDGGLASAAFIAFDAGAIDADIVKTLRVSPRVARELHREYAEMLGQIIVDGTDAVKIRRLAEDLGEEGHVANGADIVRVLEAVVSPPPCLACYRPPRFCLPCFHNRPRQALAVAARCIAKLDAQRVAEEKKQLVRDALDQSKDARRPPAKRPGE